MTLGAHRLRFATTSKASLVQLLAEMRLLEIVSKGSERSLPLRLAVAQFRY